MLDVLRYELPDMLTETVLDLPDLDPLAKRTVTYEEQVAYMEVVGQTISRVVGPFVQFHGLFDRGDGLYVIRISNVSDRILERLDGGELRVRRLA